MKNILSVATAGILADQLTDLEHIWFPRVDYVELQRLLNVTTLDYSSYENNAAGKFFRYMETQIRSDIYLATISRIKSGEYPLVFAWSERAGIPFAAYLRLFPAGHKFVTMFQCWSDRQEFAVTKFGLFSAMDGILVHCQSMRDKLVALGAPEERIRIIHYSIDQRFFSPMPDAEQKPDLVVSVGEPRSRDYPALFKAFETIPAVLEVAGYGHWYAREKDSIHNSYLPANVSLIRRLSYFELKQLYASAQFVVLPVRDLVYSAGATTCLEAGSMARAVIAFHSKGISDYIIDGETGILVEPGNAQAMKDAIQYLLAHPKEATRLGENARQRILDELNLETYVRNIANALMEK